MPMHYNSTDTKINGQVAVRPPEDTLKSKLMSVGDWLMARGMSKVVSALEVPRPTPR